MNINVAKPLVRYASEYVQPYVTEVSTKVAVGMYLTFLLIIIGLLYWACKSAEGYDCKCSAGKKHLFIKEHIEYKFTKKALNKLKKQKNLKMINGDYILKRKDGISVVLCNYDIYNLIKKGG